MSDAGPVGDAVIPWITPRVISLQQAITFTLAYADVFAYPLAFTEVHRYLIGLAASPKEVQSELDRGVSCHLWQTLEGYYALPGRLDLVVAARKRRMQHAARMWERATLYGRMIAALPFVRMVAVTGALTMGNVEADADYDYLVITDAGRVWMTRLMIVQLVVRIAEQRGDEICPNYLLADDALHLDDHDLFHAHELAQMVPLYGMDIYHQLRAANAWAGIFLPNASAAPEAPQVSPGWWAAPRLPLELALRTPLGRWLDRVEMERMQRKLSASSQTAEVRLAAHQCKGHVGGHGHATREAFAARIAHLA